jgi:hypothetical protein
MILHTAVTKGVQKPASCTQHNNRLDLTDPAVSKGVPCGTAFWEGPDVIPA